jgi:Spy/CpxP family protein refolding chaperone
VVGSKHVNEKQLKLWLRQKQVTWKVADVRMRSKIYKILSPEQQKQTQRS